MKYQSPVVTVELLNQDDIVMISLTVSEEAGSLETKSWNDQIGWN